MTNAERTLIVEEVDAIIPQLTQHQGSLAAQLIALERAAVRLGLYDAHDWLKEASRLDRLDRLKASSTGSKHPLSGNPEAVGQAAQGLAEMMADVGAYVGRFTFDGEDGRPFAGVYLVEGMENVEEFERANEAVNADE